MLICYENACVFTPDSSKADCFIVENGLFAFVGAAHDAHRLYPDAQRIDLGGRFVCPGFNDSHMHLLSLGGALSQAQLSKHTSSLASMLQALSVFASEHPDEPWVLGRGWNQDYFTDVSRFPDRHDLDSVCPDKPCMITRACGHIAIANTAALELAGISLHAPHVEGGKVYTDDQETPNGVLAENAISLVSSLIPKPDKETIKRRLQLAMACANRYGITSVHSDDFSTLDLSFEDVLAAYQELKRDGLMSVRVNEQCLLETQDMLQAFLDAGYCTGWGDDWLRIGPLKILTDGSLGARTAYLRDPYTDAPQTCGIAIYEQEALSSLIMKAHCAGMQIAAHAIGDAAADMVLDAVAAACSIHPAENMRHGIVHAQVFSPEHIKRLESLKMHAYIQPIFLDYDTQIVHHRLGARAKNAYPAASLLASGATFSAGSDCPVEPCDVMEGIQCAVTRMPVTRQEDSPYLPHEALDLCEAIRSFTEYGAYASFEESIKGQIAPGFLADFTVLACSPFDVPPEKIHAISVDATYAGGTCVFSRKENS